jgi:hypothetical protein
MRSVVFLLASCGTAATSPAPPLVKPASIATSDAGVVLAIDASPPPPRVTTFARMILKSPWGMRRTYALTRAGDHIELVIETWVWANADKRVHLDGSEFDEAMWLGPSRAEYAGAAHVVGNKVQLELALTKHTEHPEVRLGGAPGQLTWTCGEVALMVRAAKAVPIRIMPESTAKTGCSGSPVRWNPPEVSEVNAWACSVKPFGPLQQDVPFTSDGSIDWVGEMVDCHIQELAYRKASPRVP